MRFSGPWHFLSNFYLVPVSLDGVTYPTAEHAYQAQKAYRPADRLIILSAPTPGAAKRLGRSIPTRGDWDDVRVEIMRGIIRAKFTHGWLAKKLLATGDIEIVEDNYWNDRFWGRCNGEGENWLGRILMEVRDELRAREATAE